MEPGPSYYTSPPPRVPRTPVKKNTARPTPDTPFALKVDTTSPFTPPSHLRRIIMDGRIHAEIVEMAEVESLGSLLFPDAIFPKRFLPTKLLSKLPRSVYHNGRWVKYPDFSSKVRTNEEELAIFLNDTIQELGKYTKGTQMRSWSSHFSSLPPSGSVMTRKPDLVSLDVAARRVNLRRSGLRIGWIDARVLGELKTTSGKVENTHWRQCDTDLANKVLCTFSAQDNRNFVLGISVCNSWLRLTLYDRGGVVNGPKFDIHRSPVDFIRIIYGLAFFTDEKIGFDPMIIRNPDDSLRITCNLLTYDVIERCFMSKTLRGRGTVCWRAEYGGMQYLIKDSWADTTREHSESHILKSIQGVEGVPTLLYSEGDSANPTDRYFTSLYRPGVEPGHAFDQRHCHRLVMLPVGDPISEFSSKKELLQAIIDAVRVHHQIYIKGVLHRDISIRNILLYTPNADDSLAVPRSPSDGQSTSSTRRGLLIDYDYAVFVGDEDRSKADATRSITLPFTASVLLRYDNEIHKAHHDLESFYYVLLWICLYYTGPNSKPKDNVRVLDEWLNVGNRKTSGWARYAANVFSADFTTVINEFTPYFEDFKPFMDDLRVAIFYPLSLDTRPLDFLKSTKFITRGGSEWESSGQKPVSHEMVIDILQDALESVVEPELRATNPLRRKRSASPGPSTLRQSARLRDQEGSRSVGRSTSVLSSKRKRRASNV